MELATPLLTAGRAVLDYALPPRCPGCGEITGEDDSFCVACWTGMRFLEDPCCETCGIPFETDDGPGQKCGACLADPPPWKSARAALAYGDISGRVAMRLKYGRRTGLARLMARHMAARAGGMADQAALIVPVPLHRWRLWQRGFNQSLLLARHIGRSRCIPVDPFVLKRVRATRPLRNLSPAERDRMVARAFALDEKRVPIVDKREVILVDDIHTSGATARACTRVLLAGGASAVHLLCWARVLPDGDD